MNPQKQKSPSSRSGFLKYWALSLQLVLAVGVTGYLGHLADKSLDLRFPLFTLLGIIAGLSGGVYRLLKELNKKNT